MATTPDTEAAHDPGRNGAGPAGPAESSAELHERLRRLEDQLAVLRAQQSQAPPPPPRAQPQGLALLPVPRAVGQYLPALRMAADRAGATVGGWTFFSEFRLIARMYFDGRYRVSRVSQFGVPAVLVLMVLNNVVWPYLPIITSVWMQLVLVALAVLLYKLLSREAGRYAEVLAYLKRGGAS